MRSPGVVAAGLFAAALLGAVGVALGTEPELPRAFVDTTYVKPTGRTLVVRAGGDFQAALDTARPGDVITLEAGATFTGNFTLPNKAERPPGRRLRRAHRQHWITIRTSAPDRALPAPGTRITPSDACAMPKIISPNTGPAVTAAPGAHHYRFIGIEFTVAPDVPINYNLILLGDQPASLADIPHDLVFDRVYIHGQPGVNTARGVALNGAWIAVVDSYISDFHQLLFDSQAIAGWTGPGPFKIVNDYLEASGENLLFGGADPSIDGLVPSDIEIRHNHFYKPLAWRVGDPAYAGTPWLVKNLFELKNAQRVLIDGNVFEYNWPDAQGGTAILFTPRNQDGTAPWSVVQDVTFTNNIVQHVSQVFGITGYDELYPSQPTERVLIQNNFVNDVNSVTWGGHGWIANTVYGITDLVMDHNTGFMDQAIEMACCGASEGAVFTNNLMPVGVYGFTGVGVLQGFDTFGTYLPEIVFAGNVLVGGDPTLYPVGDFFPGSLDDVGFVDLVNGDYALAPTSVYKNAGTDGKDPGADFEVLGAATDGVIMPLASPSPQETALCRNAGLDGTDIGEDEDAVETAIGEDGGAPDLAESGSAGPS